MQEILRKYYKRILHRVKMKIYAYKGKHNISGEKIRQARVIQRISQSDLAAKLQLEGVTIERDSISRIENGSRFVTDYELLVFSRVLGVSILFLLEDGIS